jgi:hypothetical protein
MGETHLKSPLVPLCKGGTMEINSLAKRDCRGVSLALLGESGSHDCRVFLGNRGFVREVPELPTIEQTARSIVATKNVLTPFENLKSIPRWG